MTMDMGDVTADVIVETDNALTRDDLAAYTFEYTNADGDTDTFRLDDVATLEDTVSLTSIRRENQRRYLSVSASIDDGYNVTLVTNQAQKAVAALELPAGVSYEFSGENETIMEALEQLVLMLLLGILLVYFIMVAQFQSLKSPFIVMFTIPLAFTGGFLALLICGMDVSIISMIGFVMLTGIIVNNGIVLVDYVNQLRAEGMERHEALVEAGVTRLRPILMTSLTTILGLIVMALGRDVGTAMMQPVAVVCIGGLLYATLMTLFVIPCIYDIMNKKALTVVTDEDMEFGDE
jgi:multidrug efflux pump subunit AcrB